MAKRKSRRRVAALAIGFLALVVAPVASAHTGELNTPVEAGPYHLVVRAIPVAAGQRTALAFRSSITDRQTGAVIAAGHVSLTVHERSGHQRGPYETSAIAGAYYLLVPITDPSAWRSLRFSITIAGPLGTASGWYVPPNLFRQWLFEPWVLGAALLGAVCFLQGFWRLRARGRSDHASWDRAVLFCLSLAALVLPLVSPLDVVGDHFLLSAHMLQHVLIGDVAPALLLVSVRGPLLFFTVPPLLLRKVGRSRHLREASARLFQPKLVLSLWALAYGGWHIPAAYDYAARTQSVHDLEHLSFVLAGLLVWSLLIDPTRQRRLSAARRLRVAAFLFLIGTVISDTLIFTFTPLYPTYAHQVERVFSLNAVRDQQLAGLVMTIDQFLTLGTFSAFLLIPMLRQRRALAMPVRRREQPV